MPTKKESLGSVLREESRRLEFTEWPAAEWSHPAEKWSGTAEAAAPGSQRLPCHRHAEEVWLSRCWQRWQFRRPFRAQQPTHRSNPAQLCQHVQWSQLNLKGGSWSYFSPHPDGGPEHGACAFPDGHASFLSATALRKLIKDPPCSSSRYWWVTSKGNQGKTSLRLCEICGCKFLFFFFFFSFFYLKLYLALELV